VAIGRKLASNAPYVTVTWRQLGYNQVRPIA
jgi:hypothetical protein